ncbi:hypothetical protein DL771_005835 [Monosporascus sp. 5C6A]|nr:hypothetical protein DL771_005835 [Monosporascus sp. 5C6A]
MRLLRTVESSPGRFEIHYFQDDSIPKYVILSHAWGEGEMTFQDMEAGHGQSKKGFEKLKNCCSYAEADGFEYVWIDTCCIDKTSSAELSGAINSMYHWYQNAERCYAYLADVSSKSDFTSSRWFTRGWTLQELIAPSAVIFLDQHWQRLGTKTSLRQAVSGSTKIPANILLGDDLETASIAQRMSWAAKRQTTRVEDRAYCLLGIFGVNMPLLYGEGERAFTRLQEEIMKISDDHSLFAWRSDDDCGGLLATEPAAFINSGKIIPQDPFGSGNEPFSVSSKGIHLGLNFIGLGQQGLGLAILHCIEIGKGSLLIAIYLRDSSLTMKYFERVRTQKFEFFDLAKYRPSQYPIRKICARFRRLRPARVRNMCSKDIVKAVEPSKAEEDVRSNAHHMQPNSTEKLLGRDDTQNRTKLLQAAEGGDEAVVGQLLALGIQADCVNAQEQTPLSIAAAGGHEAVVKLLLDRGDVKADAKDKNQMTPLLLAAANGHVGVVWLLLTRDDVAPGSTDKMGWTLLSYAARQGHEALVKVLLVRSDIQPYLVDRAGRTSLSHAAECGQKAIVQLLLGMGKGEPDGEDSTGRTPLSYAVGREHVAVVRLLLETGRFGAHKEAAYGEALPWAAQKGYETIVKLLLEQGTKVEGDKSMQLAARNGHASVVKLLLKHGAKAEGDKSLELAAMKGHASVIKLLLEHGAKAEGDKSLELAAMKGHASVIKLLLENGADVEGMARDWGRTEDWRMGCFPDGTPLMLAAERGDEAVVKLLLEKGANIEAEDGVCATSLWRAAGEGHEAVVILLLEKGAKIKAGDLHRAPLKVAAENGHKAVVNLLREKGAEE